MRTIAIVNQKGGCGKTTTAINLAATLARRGLRLLLVDMDPQSHCAAGLGVPESRVERGIGDVLLGNLDHPIDGREFLWEVSRNLHLAPSTVSLAGLEAAAGGLSGLPDRDRRLAKLLAWLAPRFDICIVDCPPTIGLLTFNALRAADEALVPVETGYLALRGAEKQIATITKVVERLGRPITHRLLPTMFDDSRAVDRDVLAALQSKYGDAVLPVVVRDHDLLREATRYGQAITEFAPASHAGADFESLADWLLSHPPEVIAAHEPPAPAPLVEHATPAAPRRAAWVPHQLASLSNPEPAAAAPSGEPADAPREHAGGRAAELVRRVRELNVRAAQDESEQPISDEHAAAPDDGAPPFPPSALRHRGRP